MNAINLCISNIEPVSSISHGPVREQIPFHEHLYVTQTGQPASTMILQFIAPLRAVPESESYSLSGKISFDFSSAQLVPRLKWPIADSIRFQL